MLSRPSSSSGSGGQQAPAVSPGGAVPTSPSFVSKPSPLAFVSPSQSPGSGAAPSPSGRLSSPFEGGLSCADSLGQQFSAVDVEYPGTSPARIVLPPPYEGEDLTDALTKQVVVIGVISRLEDEASQLLDRILLAQVFSSKKCGSSRERRNSQEDRETVLTGNPNCGGDAVAPSPNPQRSETERAFSLENGSSRGRSHGKGRGRFDERSRRRDGSQRDHNAGSRAGEARFHTPPRTKGWAERKPVGNGRERDWLDGKIKNHYDQEKGVLYVQYVWGSQPHECLKDESRAGENLAKALERHEADSFRALLFMFSVRFSL